MPFLEGILYMGGIYMLTNNPGPIGLFDSGYGGLTIFEKIREAMPEYDYLYLGDNARAHMDRALSRWFTALPCKR